MWPDWAIVESSWQNLLTKVAQYDSWLLGYLKKINKCKNWCEYFLVNFFTTISGRTGHDSAFTTFLEKLISLWPSSFSNGRWPFDFNDIGSCSGQCDQIGQFLGYSGKHHSLVKTTVAPFGANFGKSWATFYFNIWSHWHATSPPNANCSFETISTCIPLWHNGRID